MIALATSLAAQSRVDRVLLPTQFGIDLADFQRQREMRLGEESGAVFGGRGEYLLTGRLLVAGAAALADAERHVDEGIARIEISHRVMLRGEGAHAHGAEFEQAGRHDRAME